MTANRAAGLRISSSVRREFLTGFTWKGGTEATLATVMQAHGIDLIKGQSTRDIQLVAARLRAAFDVADAGKASARAFGYKDSLVAASAFMRGEKLVTADVGLYKRALDLGIPADLVGARSAHVPNPVKIPKRLHPRLEW